ncbi:hypothetical protein, partial [Marichromatium sp. AB31]|uniref:hypothetical protein n=1 Tax=Marichromatium sp. AB31 TaxID=2483362 RepID=UPI0011CE668A
MTNKELIYLLAPIANAFIAYSIFRLSKVQREEIWLRGLWDFQKDFWNDENAKKVRLWISCDESYKEIEDAISKRLKGQASASDYEKLDCLDKFASLLIGYEKIAPKDSSRHSEVMRRIFHDYWVKEIKSEKRKK